MKRLPRKYKKRVKKIVEQKRAFKILQASMASAMGRSQIMIITSQFSHGPSGIALKALEVAKTVSNTAQAIRKIMSEPPNSWRDFIR